MSAIIAAYQGESGLALDQTDNGLPAVLTDDDVGFSVTNPAMCFDNGLTLLDELPIGNDAAPVDLAVAFFTLFLTAQLLP